jgi:hypothetical protein
MEAQFSAPAQKGPVAHPASYTTGTGFLSPEVKRPGRGVDHLPSSIGKVNPLNAELNPICHLLVLLGHLTFMGPCIVITFQYTRMSNKMQRHTVYLYLETALHVSGGASTQHQEGIQLYL